MSNTIKFIFAILFVIIIIILTVGLSYRYYIVNSCEDDECLKRNLIFNLKSLDSFLRKLKKKEIELKKKLNIISNSSHDDFSNKSSDVIIEGFLPSLGSFFSGSTSETLPIENPPSGTGMVSSPLLGDKKVSLTFPPKNDDFKDADNKDLLSSIGSISPTSSKPYLGLNKLNDITNSKLGPVSNSIPSSTASSPPLSNPTVPSKIIKQNINQVKNISEEDNYKVIEPLSSLTDSSSSSSNYSSKMNSLKNNCQFYGDKCPSGYSSLGDFSIQGVSDKISLSCGSIQDTKPAKAVAEIKDNGVYQIHIIDQGHGYLPDKPPKILIQGGNGSGAEAEPIIDDDGFLKVITVKNNGQYYTDTPTILIDPPYMNSSCHLCCKDDAL